MSRLALLLSQCRMVISGYVIQQCVGVDLSSTAIKMVELEKNSLQIKNYQIGSVDSGLINQGNISDIDKVSAALYVQWQKLRPRCLEVAVAIPYNAVMLRDMRTPYFKYPHQLEAWIRSELVQELDNPDIDFDYYVKQTMDDEQIISLVVAKKEKIEEYQAVMQITGLSPGAIEVENFAIAHLLTLLMPPAESNIQQTIFLELSASRARGFIFIGNKFILFQEIDVNYHHYFADLLATYGDNIDSLHHANLYSYISQLLLTKKIVATTLLTAIVNDTLKLLQMLRSSLLVEQNTQLAIDYHCYIFGGNSNLPSLAEYFLKIVGHDFMFASVLQHENQHIPNHDLSRLFTALALATWGHKIEKN
jgi:Tfp pilus assembly PilM family ATPase